MRLPLTDHSDKVAQAAVDHRFGPSGIPELDGDQIARITSLREHSRLFARHIVSACPPSFERDQALVSLDNACSWGARSISRNE